MNQVDWNKLVAEHAPPFGAFLQSWEWGEFQAALGFEVMRLQELIKGKVVVAQAVKLPLPFKINYWHVPKGPLGTASNKVTLEYLQAHLPGGAFLKLEPAKAWTLGTQVKDRQPSVTSILDLTKSETELAAGMKAKTRYNIRLAEKKGVTASIVGLERFDDLVRLMQQTAERDKFSLHEIERYRTMLQILKGQDCHAFMAMAFYEDRPLAANIMIDAFGMRTYLHGASSNLYRNVMAPYALHDFLWRDAKAKGLKAYDFWGIAPPEAGESHPWAGISRFKTGFGGETVRMPGTLDIAKNPALYSLYRLAKKLRP
ncbi:MAG: peptidoglycan bridge formation glycyltransferase FemA/FemB family protein [Patescibacteria group bacterium]